MRYIKYIINKFQDTLKKEIIVVSLQNSTQVILRFVIGILNIKIISLWLGASGMAIMGQFTNFIQIVGNIAGGGFNQGVTKLAAQYNDTVLRKHLLISNSLISSIALSVILGIISYIFSEELSKWILKDLQFIHLFKISGIVIFSFSFSNIILGVLNGLHSYKSFIRVNIGLVVIAFVISVPCIYIWKLEGALSALYISGLTNILFISFYCRKIIYKAFKQFNISIHILKRLFGFGLMLAIASSIGPLVSIFIRNTIISEYSINAAGWWEGVSRISKTFFGICITTISLYYVPQISKRHEKDLNQFVWSTIKTILPYILLGILLIYFSRDLIIRVLFTKEFFEMRNLFLYQCIGDSLRIFSWFFAINFIIKEKIKIYILIEIIFAFIYTALVYFLIPILGKHHTTVPYMINTFLYLIVTQFIYWKYIIINSKFKIS